MEKVLKGLYFIILFLSAITIGGLIATNADGSLWWLGYNMGFSFEPGQFISLEVFKLTFGLTIKISISQIMFIFIAVFVFYKTSPKLFPKK